MRLAIIGAGRVGKTLGTALRAKGHSVTYGVRQPSTSGEASAKTVDAAIRGAEVVILATPWTVTEALVCEHSAALTGKIVIDATNPLNPSETRLALGFDTSGAELLQSQARCAILYKAFNTVGVEVLANPRFPEGAAVMFVAGPDGPEKRAVLRIVSDVGFDAIDAGELKVARLLEPLAMLWGKLAQARGEGGEFAFLLGRRQLREHLAGKQNGIVHTQAETDAR